MFYSNQIKKENSKINGHNPDKQTKKELEDYSIKSPIDGVVLSKEYKAGDSINSNYKGTSLMVVANMSKVKFDMSIDELDIAKVKK